MFGRNPWFEYPASAWDSEVAIYSFDFDRHYHGIARSFRQGRRWEPRASALAMLARHYLFSALSIDRIHLLYHLLVLGYISAITVTTLKPPGLLAHKQPFPDIPVIIILSTSVIHHCQSIFQAVDSASCRSDAISTRSIRLISQALAFAQDPYARQIHLTPSLPLR